VLSPSLKEEAAGGFVAGEAPEVFGFDARDDLTGRDLADDDGDHDAVVIDNVVHFARLRGAGGSHDGNQAFSRGLLAPGLLMVAAATFLEARIHTFERGVDGIDWSQSKVGHGGTSLQETT